MRKGVIRTVIEEIIADIDNEKSLILLNIHWVGGIHTRLEVKKNKTGEHGKSTDKTTVELVRELAKSLSDKDIAPILNRLKLKTGKDNNWTRDRVRFLRNHNQIPAYDGKKETDQITLEEAAERLGICAQSVMSLIKKQIIRAKQICTYAPWSISIKELEREEVKDAVKDIKDGVNRKKRFSRCEEQMALLQ